MIQIWNKKYDQNKIYKDTRQIENIKDKVLEIRIKGERTKE